MTPPSTAPTVQVGPFRVADLGRAEVVRRAVQLTVEMPDRPVPVFALHVGGLNEHSDDDFVAAMNAAPLTYADGGSTVWLAKLAGAEQIERAPTTDVGWELLGAIGAQLGRTPRVALLGGPDGVSRAAGEALEAAGAGVVVFAEHGFHDTWDQVLAELRASTPDATIIGLGAPREMMWTQRHLDSLPPGLLLTCGGWFGYLVGNERRAPRLLRRSGLEWIARFAQAPRRLGPRYIRGAWSTLQLAAPVILTRRSSGR